MKLTNGPRLSPAGTAVVLFSIWIPLWWAVPIGAILAYGMRGNAKGLVCADPQGYCACKAAGGAGPLCSRYNCI